MSKQQQAPGALELVRAYVNSVDIEQGSDQLLNPPALGDWLRERGLLEDHAAAKPEDLTQAIALREALRAVLVAHTEGSSVPPGASEAIDAIARTTRLRLRCRDGAMALEAQDEGVPGALGRLLAIVHDSITAGTWSRLKACRLHTCEWAFYDHSKNRSGVWCNMEVCGNRTKARTYRQRRPPAPS